MGTIVATSPGDIVVEFTVRGSDGKFTSFNIPLKSLSVNKSIDVSPEYGTGSHQAYAHVVGKIAYEGDFTIGTWYVSDEANPSTWDHLVRTYLTVQEDEGLPREFNIYVHARIGESMVRQGTGTYGNWGKAPESEVGETSNVMSEYSYVTARVPDGTVIESYERCILKGDGMDVPEVGGTVTRKYPFQVFRRRPL